MIRQSFLIVALFLGGCASSIGGRTLSPTAPAGAPVDGLPFRQRTQLTIELYKKGDKGYERVAQKAENMADPANVSILSFKGDAFATANLQLGLRSDSTLASLNLTSQSQAAGDLKDLGKAASDTASAVAGLKTTQQKLKDDQLAAAETKLSSGESKELDVALAISAATVAQKELDEIPAGSLGSVRAKKEGEVLALKLKANAAARKAGQPTRPFPDV